MAMMAIEVIRISTSLRVVSEVILVSIPTQPLPIATVFEVFWKLRAHENSCPSPPSLAFLGVRSAYSFTVILGIFTPILPPLFNGSMGTIGSIGTVNKQLRGHP